MSAPRFFTLRGYSPQVVAVLMAMAMIAAGIGFPPVSLAASVAEYDDGQQSDSQPCEESPDELAEDEESSAGKHTATVGISLTIDAPALISLGVVAPFPRRHSGTLASAAPIRGPPAAA